MCGTELCLLWLFLHAWLSKALGVVLVPRLTTGWISGSFSHRSVQGGVSEILLRWSGWVSLWGGFICLYWNQLPAWNIRREYAWCLNQVWMSVCGIGIGTPMCSHFSHPLLLGANVTWYYIFLPAWFIFFNMHYNNTDIIEAGGCVWLHFWLSACWCVLRWRRTGSQSITKLSKNVLPLRLALFPPQSPCSASIWLPLISAGLCIELDTLPWVLVYKTGGRSRSWGDSGKEEGW